MYVNKCDSQSGQFVIYFIYFVCWVILHAFLLSADCFLNFFQKIPLGIPSDCQTVWPQIRPNDTPYLIWAQSVYKVYQIQQTTKVATDG